MLTPEQTLADQGVPIDSFYKAGMYINKTDRPESSYRKSLEEILGEQIPPFPDALTAKLTYAYFAQEYLRARHEGALVNIDMLYVVAQQKATSLITTQSYHWAAEQAVEEVIVHNDDGSVKHKKGWKRDRAFELYNQHPGATKKEIMDVFKAELGMSHSGAQTYYYNAKNELG